MDDRVAMGRTCPWCSAAAPVEATQCPDCGAALAQRESIGDLVIPGVTSVDPALLDADGRPLHIPGGSSAQGMAGGIMVAAMAGGPAGLTALSGLAVVAAAEYANGNRGVTGGPSDLDGVGRPSAAALEVAERLDHAAERDPTAASDDPWRDDPGHGATTPA